MQVFNWSKQLTYQDLHPNNAAALCQCLSVVLQYTYQDRLITTDRIECDERLKALRGLYWSLVRRCMEDFKGPICIFEKALSAD